MLEVVDDIVASGDESSQRAEALGEGTHNEVHLVGEAEMVSRAGSVFAEHTEPVSVVNHYRCVVLFGKFCESWERYEVSEHRIYAVNDNELRCVGFAGLELFLKGVHVVVLEFIDSAPAEAASVYDAGVVGVIEKGVSSTESEGGHYSEIYLESGTEGYRFLHSHEFCKPFFKLIMDVKGTVEEAAAGAAGSVLLDSSDCCFFEPRVV